MCGIAGFSIPRGLSAHAREQTFRSPLVRMTASLWHRGPDAQRALLLDGMALGHTRLSIVDLASGHQPMTDPTTGLTVVFNGEIFNHVELRERYAPSYRFQTRCDTEVILAAFLARGIDCVKDFVGQFAFALWDPRDQTLWMARDRVGIRPLFYARTEHGLAFASEAKALFASGEVSPSLDLRAVKETVHLWAPVSPRTFFEGVLSLPPASVARFKEGELQVSSYWALSLSPRVTDEGEAVEAVQAALQDAVRLRLRADVPVAAYLSGGLDSSLICALAQEQLGGTLQTFSVRFAHDRYDEGAFQDEVARALKTEHHSVTVSDSDIGALLPAVVDHAEAVTLRSAPAPFFRLSKLVREHQTKVVLTGEGADEVFLGYDLFKETQVRQFWARRPQSQIRPLLFRKLYPYLPLSSQSPEMLQQFFGEGLEDVHHPLFSHRIRYSNSGRISRFFGEGFLQAVAAHDPGVALVASIPAAALDGPPLSRAQHVEMATLLSGYLLSTQGDRMLMSNSVEGRFPFLDHRVMELAAKLPARLKLRGLREKHILRKVAQKRVPQAVLARTKFPYRAPIAETLTGPTAPDWSRELLSASSLDAVGVFDGKKVTRLLEKLRPREGNRTSPSEADNMALMAIASTQLLADRLLRPRAVPASHLASVEVQTR
jgi:asparagine synthase (glutamine-hydrolysing)